MKALWIDAARALRVGEAGEAAAPGPGEVAVRVRRGGICGSDLHYYADGGFGPVRLKQPMILGHEIAGEVEAVGDGAGDLAAGTVVAVNPSRPCGTCAHCRAGARNRCSDMRFLGSAMRTPHVDGGFREVIVRRRDEVFPLRAGIGAELAAFSEPLAVCLHAVERAGPLLGRRVLVTGGGPIGALTLLAARRAGAASVTLTDILDAPLAMARRLGADAALNVRDGTEAVTDGAGFDVAFEAAGSPAALALAVAAVRPGGTVVQIGQMGDATLSMPSIVAKEISLRGSFRFDGEFGMAVRFIEDGSIDVRPLLSATLPLSDAREAFELALDKDRAMKVQLAFD